MKLYYFGLKGRAETSRVMMRVSGTEFEDVVFTPEEWGAKYKAMSPSGQAPWLELDDGKVLSQSAAIHMYCAGKAGFLPADPFQVARTTELFNCLEDIWTTMATTFKLKTTEEKIEARKALMEPEGATAKKFQGVESMIASNTTAYYCGEQPTLADFHIFTWLGFLRTGFIDGITPEMLASYKKMEALRSKVASMPKVKELYAGADGFEP